METRGMKNRRRAYRQNQDGTKSIPVSPETLELIKQQQTAFRQKFGREPRKNDPIFFYPNADTPQPMDVETYEQAIMKAMGDTGLPVQLHLCVSEDGSVGFGGNPKIPH